MAAVAVVVSCNKVDMNIVPQSDDFSNQELITFDFGGLQVEDDAVSSKIVDVVSGKTHSFSWEAGDEISMFMYKKPSAAGEKASQNVVNFSRNSFTTTESGSTASFSGMIPLDKIGNTLGTAGTCAIFAIYPAVELTVEEDSYAGYYKVRGPSISSVQDGTGLKYCYFLLSAKWSSGAAATYPEFRLGSKDLNPGLSYNFNLSNALIKFKMQSIKNVKTIVIDSGNTNSRLVGELVFQTRYSKAQYEGEFGTILTIENDGVLPDEIYFACNYLNNKGNGEIKFTFTAEDESTMTKTYKPSAVYGQQGIYDIGTVELWK